MIYFYLFIQDKNTNDEISCNKFDSKIFFERSPAQRNYTAGNKNLK